MWLFLFLQYFICYCFKTIFFVCQFVQQELPKGEWLCCGDCSRIHNLLQILLHVGPLGIILADLNSFLQKQKDKGLRANPNIKWRSTETKILLSKALATFHVSGCLYYDMPLELEKLFSPYFLLTARLFSCRNYLNLLLMRRQVKTLSLRLYSGNDKVLVDKLIS